LLRFHVLRSLFGGPATYDVFSSEATLGSTGTIALHGERFAQGEEARVKLQGKTLVAQSLSGGNGVFLRLRQPCELDFGDEFIVGDQLMRIESNPKPQNGPSPGPTYFYSSPTWPSSFRIVQIFEGNVPGACVVARGNAVVIGGMVGDLVIPGDPLISDQHCLIEEQASAIVMTDLGSRTGVFVRIRGRQELVHGDEILVGRTRLALEFASNVGSG
jgi:hypothetical protein